jgi:hypothetical protein
MSVAKSEDERMKFVAHGNRHVGNVRILQSMSIAPAAQLLVTLLLSAESSAAFVVGGKLNYFIINFTIIMRASSKLCAQ